MCLSLFTFYFAHIYFTVKRFDILQIPGSSVPNSVHLEARSLCSLSALWKGNRRMKSQSAITATDWQIHLLWALSFLSFTVNIIQPCHGNISRWDMLCQKCSDANLSLKSTCVKNLWDCVYQITCVQNIQIKYLQITGVCQSILLCYLQSLLNKNAFQ